MNVVVDETELGKDTDVLVLQVQSLGFIGLKTLWRFLLALFKT